ncbi:MAG: hypothetical protein ACI8S6_002944 [Myxococcota bacterium]|jgi:hypothetical protein
MDCEPSVISSDDDPATGDCLETPLVMGGTLLAINAVCTDPDITALGSRRHVVMVPATPATDLLWLHLGGTGGRPLNTTKLGLAALSEGYRYISLAYPSEPSIAARCTCEGLGPRPLGCEELARTEVLTGEDASPWLDMEPDEAIIPRLTALLTSLHAQQPGGGWDAYIDDEGAPEWALLAVSGFSQGGGMAGLIARDHRVDRALYFSKGRGSALEAMADPSTYQSCDATKPCEGDVGCCPFDDLSCGSPPEEGGLCAVQVPDPWTDTGLDTDGDYRGEGTAVLQLTPPERQLAIVHIDEGAWDYSPEVFSVWGMGERSDYLDAGSSQGPYSPDEQLFTLDLPPNPAADCSTHQSMGADACMADHPDTGQPAMLPVWLHAMTLP